MRNAGGRIIKNVEIAQLREVNCRWCGEIFYICRSCWRGQAYCSDQCREAGKRKTRREAQKRYRETEKGKNQHCEAENRRRMGLSKKNKRTMADTSCESHYTFRKKKMRVGFSSKEQAEGAVGTEIKIGKCHYCDIRAAIVTEFPERG